MILLCHVIVFIFYEIKKGIIFFNKICKLHDDWWSYFQVRKDFGDRWEFIKRYSEILISLFTLILKCLKIENQMRKKMSVHLDNSS